MTDSTSSLVLAVDTTQTAKASVDLDKLTASGEKTEAQFNKTGQAATGWQRNMAGVDAAMKSTAERSIELSQATQRIIDRYDPLGTKLRALQSDMELFQREMGNSTSNAAMKTFQGLEDEIAKTSKLMSTAGVEGFEKMGAAADKGAFSTVGAKRELMVLGHEALTGNFSRMPGSFMVLAERMSLTSALFSPMTLGIAAFVAVGAGIGVLAAHAESLARSMNTLQVQMDATGRDSDFTKIQFKELIDQMALMPGVSKTSADAILSTFTKTHEIGAPLFKDLSLIVGDFASATGTDAVSAAKELAKAFADPAKGADSLDASLGTLSASTILQIKQLSDANNILGAQKLLYDAVTESVLGLSHTGLTPMQQAAEGVRKSWDEAMHSLGESKALTGVNAALVGIIGSVQWLIDHRDGLIATLKVVPVLGAPFAAAGMFGSAPKNSGSSGSWTDSAQEDAKKLEDLTKNAILLGGGYTSAATNAAKLATQQKVLTDAISANIAAGNGDSEAVKKLKDELAGLQEYMAPKATKDTTRQDAHAQMALDLERYKKDASEYSDVYANEQKRLEAMHAAGLLDEADYTNNKTFFIKMLEAVKEDAFTQEIARLQKEKYSSSNAVTDALNNAKQVMAIQALLAKAKADAATNSEIAAIMDMAAANKIAQAYRNSKDAAQTYLDTLMRTQSRDLSGMGLGNSERGRLAGFNQIDDKYEKQRLDLEKSRRDAEFNGTFGNDAQKKYDNELELIKTFNAKALSEYDKYYAAKKAKEANGSLGASEALNNYLDETRNVYKQTGDLVSKSFKGMEDALTNFVMTGKLDFSSLANSIISDMVRMEIRKSITGPMATTALSMFGFADGGAFGSSSVHAFADGGSFSNSVLTQPTPFMFANGGGFSQAVAGESGPEAVMPLSRDSSGKLGVKASGSSAPVQNFNVVQNFTVGDVASISMVRQAVAGSEKRIAAGIGRSMNYGGALS